MPIDTREERQSALGFLIPGFIPGAFPGIMDQPTRQAATWIYAGILAASTAGGSQGRRLGRVRYAERVVGPQGVYVFDSDEEEKALVLMLTLKGLLGANRQPRKTPKRQQSVVTVPRTRRPSTAGWHRSERAARQYLGVLWDTGYCQYSSQQVPVLHSY